jgi:hypothetical protein
MQASETAVAADAAKLLVVVPRVVLQTEAGLPTARLIVTRVRERLEAARNKRERVGGSHASNPQADELTRIVTILDRTRSRLAEAVEGWMRDRSKRM